MIRAAALLAALVLIAGCGGGDDEGPAQAAASTLERTLGDPDGDGALDARPGEPLLDRSELAPARAPGRVLATIGVMTDLHVRDEESPSRVPYLDRYGEPFQPTFRPQEALSAQVVAAAVRAVNRQAPDATLVLGDVIDNAQRNELALAQTLLDGGRARPDSGGPGYAGVQTGDNPDPFYYRPDVDPPRHRRLLAAAQQPFAAEGLDAPWYGVAGNHDLLLQGELAPTGRTDAIAAGDRLVTSLDPRAELPDTATTEEAVDALLGAAEGGRSLEVPPDSERVAVTPAQLVAAFAGGQPTRTPDRLDYSIDIGPVRAIVLDVVNRSGGAEPVTDDAQLAWLREQLAAADDRPVVVAVHQPPPEAILQVLDEAAGVVAVLRAHNHANRIEPRAGYWILGTSALADHPMQVRMLRVRENALETWMVDQDGRGEAGTARELAFLDAQGGRPGNYAGAAADRNARLYLTPR
ncbi:MAG: metallophosphoesterase [Solirubrobacteraceae bacterium]